MNILELLNNELNNMDLTLEEKIRYIYIRTCELFSYDYKYFYLDNYDNKDELYELRNKKYNLENINNYLVTCSTYTNEIFKPIIEKLLNIKVQSKGSDHVWAETNNIKIDSTQSNDLTRVKMKLSTKGFNFMNKKDYNFKKIDNKINYIDNDYKDIKKENNNILCQYSNDNILINKLYKIQELFNSYQFKYYSDANYAIYYLINKLLTLSDVYKIKTAYLYQINNNNWSYINLYNINLDKENIFFVLLYFNYYYYFKKISYIDFLNYIDSYNGYKESVLKNIF